MILTVRRQHRAQLVQRRRHRCTDRGVREVPDELRAHKQCGGLIRREHHRRQMVPADKAVTDASLADDWHACFGERSHVAINGAQADLEMPRQLFGPNEATPLEVHHHRNEPIRSIHRA